MKKIWIITEEQLSQCRKAAKTVFNRDFEPRGISTDRIVDTDSLREEFVLKCCTELDIRTLSDTLLSELINARKSGELSK